MEGNRQVVVYDTRACYQQSDAIVLPIPIKNRGRGRVLEFIDLSEFDTFFDDLESLFPRSLDEFSFVSPDTQGFRFFQTNPVSASKLTVEQVGLFEVSFVPQPEDFFRLDERFNLTNSVLAKLPQYTNYGFVVFKLRPANSLTHPMAFWFESSDSSRLYYPTVHVQQGRVEDIERFDHVLYGQGQVQLHPGMLSTPEVEPSKMQQNIAAKSQGVVKQQGNLFKQLLAADLPNRDTWYRLQ